MTPLRALIFTAVSSKIQTETDKMSLPEQERLCRAFADANDMIVIETLSISGHSRSETDIFTLFEDYAAIGVTAYHKLRQHWIAGNFDVLICVAPHRLGRSSSIVTFILENVIKRGRRAYFIQGGWVDESNADFFIAMSAPATKMEIKHRVKVGLETIRGRAGRGLNTRSMPFTHQAVKDGRGRDLRLELRAEAMPLVRAATRLLLSGMGWLAMTKQLQDEGYRNPVTGGNFGHYQIRAIFYSPYSWGFAGTGYWGKSGEWAFDPTVASPPGVNIVYNPSVPIPALWEGEEAFQVQAELRRRGTLMRGRAMPHTKHALTGLMVCGVCGRRMVICYSGARTKAYGDIIYWACRNTKARHLGYRCANDKYAPDRELKKQISAFLSRIRDEGLLSLDELFAAPSEKSDLARINAERDDVTRQIQTLIYRQSKAAENLQIMYAEELSNLSKRLEALDLESLSAVQREQGQVIQRKTFDRLSSDLDNIWSQNAGEVNRLLLAFMGKFRFVVLEREIVDIKAI